MARRDDHGHAPCHGVEDQRGQRSTFGIGEGELLGEIGQDADAANACVDEQGNGALLALQVERPALVERGRYDWENAGVQRASFSASRAS
jgi:hypothetical protein